MGRSPTFGPDQRAAVLERHRTLKMAKSAHAYVRGNTAKFYEWLDGHPGGFPEGPAIWICGDCHIGNLGPLADADVRIAIQIRDLDQTVIGNPAFDLIRLGLSLATAARGSDLPGVVTALIIEHLVRGYVQGLDPAHDSAPPPQPDVVKVVRDRAFARKWEHMARERLDDVKPTIPLGQKFWALSEDEHNALTALFRELPVRDLILALNGRRAGYEVSLIDAAYWMKGCSSLGFLRYAVLLEINGAKEKKKLALVDLKEAVASVVPWAPGKQASADNGERVVAGARALSPNLGERMVAAQVLGKSVVMRELLPQDLKIEIDQFTREEAVLSAHYLAYVVGKAHGRQMDEQTREAWRREVSKHHASDLEAPSWLWSSVVALAGTHEVGYLDHCRRFSLTRAA